jgi:EAL domain-containing protein (putative c-di-GMP-specific phosphodiesterase class I)/GGDEF domain-containing protein
VAFVDPPSEPLSQRMSLWLRGLRRFVAGDVAPAPRHPALPGQPTAARGPVLPSQRGRINFDAQAEAVELLRHTAHTDAETGLPNRRYFIARLASALGESSAGGRGLLLLRVLQFDGLALRVGDDATSRMLSVVADLLAAYPLRVPGAFAGRLNRSDFALCLPAGGVTDETADTLLRALRATPAAMNGAAELVVGGVDGLRGETVSRALAAADTALAQAESAGPFCIEIHHAGSGDIAAQPMGERAWRVRIDEALHEGRASLAEFPVLARDGRLLHLECPLRVQLDIGGPFVEARRWLPMAARGRLMPRVDLVALDLALLAITRDAQRRSVHFSAASLVTAGFVGAVQRRLEATPEASAQLCIEIADGVALDRALPRLREAAAAWRRHGVRLGVEHAGASMRGLSRLAGIGLDHVKIESRFVREALSEPDVRAFATGLVDLLHGMRLQAHAQGIADAGELAALWSLGFDAATGPAVRPPPAAGDAPATGPR